MTTQEVFADLINKYGNTLYIDLEEFQNTESESGLSFITANNIVGVGFSSNGKVSVGIGENDGIRELFVDDESNSLKFFRTLAVEVHNLFAEEDLDFEEKVAHMTWN